MGVDLKKTGSPPWVASRTGSTASAPRVAAATTGPDPSLRASGAARCGGRGEGAGGHRARGGLLHGFEELHEPVRFFVICEHPPVSILISPARACGPLPHCYPRPLPAASLGKCRADRRVCRGTNLLQESKIVSWSVQNLQVLRMAMHGSRHSTANPPHKIGGRVERRFALRPSPDAKLTRCFFANRCASHPTVAKTTCP